MHKIKGFQSFCLIAMSVAGGWSAVCGTPAGTFAGAAVLAPIAAVLACVYGKLQQKNWRKLRKNPFVSVALAIYAVLAILMAIRLMTLSTALMVATSLPKTPRVLTLMFIGVTALLALKAGKEPRERAAGLIGAVAALLLVILLVAALPRCELELLRQEIPKSMGDMGKNVVWSGGLILPMLFFTAPTVKASPKIKGGAAAAACLGISLMLARNGAVLGKLAQTAFLPSYMATQVLKFGDFFQRFELLAATAELLCKCVAIIICLVFAQNAIGCLVPRLKRFLKYALPCITVLITAILLQSTNAALAIISPPTPWIILPLTLPLLLAIKK